MVKYNISVLIIESDPESLEHTTELLQANTLVSDVESAVDSDQALLKIIDSYPDMVLLEYPAKGKSGKELIRFIQTKLTDATIVFVSNTKEYAANAIHTGIFNYLLKPVSKVELGKITRTVHLAKQTNIQERINQIIEKTPDETRLKLQTTKGYLIFAPEEILYCKADGVYSELYLTNDRVEMSFLPLSKLDEIFSPFDFFRASRSILINLKYIRKIYRHNNSIILSSEGKEYEVKGSRPNIKNLSQFDTD